MKPRTLLFAALSVAVVASGAIATGCFQELDPNAASGAGLGADAGAAQSLDATTTWQLCQSPSCDLPSGEIPFLAQTPPVYLPDGGTTEDPCDDVEQAAMAVRQTYCAGCHQAPAGQAGLNFVLDDQRLVGALSQTATDDAGQPARMVIPGAPTHSWLYERVAQGMGGAQGGMPPLAMAGYPSIPRPTSADLSILYAWIVQCVPGADGGGYAFFGGDYAPGGNAAVGTAGSTDGGGD